MTPKQKRAASVRMKALHAAKRAEKEGQRRAMNLANETMREQFKQVSEPDYTSLASVFTRAYAQAATGKGKERHAQDRPFEEQPMQSISVMLGTEKGMLYQAVKKTQEAARLPKDAAVEELLGAINYLAGAVIFMEKDRAF